MSKAFKYNNSIQFHTASAWVESAQRMSECNSYLLLSHARSYCRLPYLEEYYETLTPEMRSLDWRQEATSIDMDVVLVLVQCVQWHHMVYTHDLDFFTYSLYCYCFAWWLCLGCDGVKKCCYVLCSEAELHRSMQHGLDCPDMVVSGGSTCDRNRIFGGYTESNAENATVSGS